MLLRVRMTAVRLAALLVALVLSGAPRVLALQAPLEPHRCTCRAGHGEHHQCECALCRRSALHAQAMDEKAPSCHRSAARRALSQGSPRSRRAPCIEGTCGDPGHAATAPAGVERFSVPEARPLLPARRGETWPDPSAGGGERTRQPERPPPRAP